MSASTIDKITDRITYWKKCTNLFIAVEIRIILIRSVHFLRTWPCIGIHRIGPVYIELWIRN